MKKYTDVQENTFRASPRRYLITPGIRNGYYRLHGKFMRQNVMRCSKKFFLNYAGKIISRLTCLVDIGSSYLIFRDKHMYPVNLYS